MFIPEYSITTKTLKNVANIEYCKAIIETCAILPHWQKQLEKEARIRTVTATLQFQGINISFDTVKKFIDKVEPATQKELVNLNTALDKLDDIGKYKDFEEDDFKTLHTLLSQDLLPQLKSGIYRSTKHAKATDPEEILAQMVELMDWYNSLDARETHPVVKAGILKARIETIVPFEKTNFVISNLAMRLALKANGYDLKDYISPEDFYNKSKYQYDHVLASGLDLTTWLEFLTEGLSYESSNIKEKVSLLARDTKVAKVSGRVRLTQRQERIVEHLQDYGILQNKDFAKVFPDVSEDSILRDLKTLMTEGLIIKSGSTKSSMYELK